MQALAKWEQSGTLEAPPGERWLSEWLVPHPVLGRFECVQRVCQEKENAGDITLLGVAVHEKNRSHQPVPSRLYGLSGEELSWLGRKVPMPEHGEAISVVKR